MTKVVIDKLQNYYGAAIRQNVGNLRITQDAIWAIFYHTVKASNETLDVQHQYSPPPPRHISKRTKTTFYKIVKWWVIKKVSKGRYTKSERSIEFYSMEKDYSNENIERKYFFRKYREITSF